MPRQILFLCTGNYYRSRFAEELFNHLAKQSGLQWVATSRGMAPDPGCNVGPISAHTKKAMSIRGMPLGEPVRFPMAVTEQDLAAADLVIALKEAEHRRMLTKQFPHWPDRVRYWHVHDLDLATGEQATAEIEELVVKLIEMLRAERKE
jgi:protein-tyrosine-phosphatase